MHSRLTRRQALAAAARIQADEFRGWALNEIVLAQIAAAADRPSEHPLAQAIVVGAAERGLRPPEPESFDAVPGHGVETTVEGRRVLVGNRKLMVRDLDLPVAVESHPTVRDADAPGSRLWMVCAYLIRHPRGVLAEFGTALPDDVEIRVWDSNAEQRFIVLPERVDPKEHVATFTNGVVDVRVRRAGRQG